MYFLSKSILMECWKDRFNMTTKFQKNEWLEKFGCKNAPSERMVFHCNHHWNNLLYCFRRDCGLLLSSLQFVKLLTLSGPVVCRFYKLLKYTLSKIVKIISTKQRPLNLLFQIWTFIVLFFGILCTYIVYILYSFRVRICIFMNI